MASSTAALSNTTLLQVAGVIDMAVFTVGLSVTLSLLLSNPAANGDLTYVSGIKTQAIDIVANLL